MEFFRKVRVIEYQIHDMVMFPVSWFVAGIAGTSDKVPFYWLFGLVAFWIALDYIFKEKN